MKKYLLASFILFFVIALQAQAVPVACCYTGGACAIANGQQQCRNTGGTPAASDTCDPNPCNGAQSPGTEAPTASELIKDEAVDIKDLEVREPTLLPSSPFYFFKNFTRGIRRVFTFDPIKKTELELRFADEKLAEAKKIAETSPERTGALTRAIDNYQRSQEALKNRIESLKETSQNPNVDRLFEKLADRTIKHGKLFAELKEKFEDKKELKEKIDAVKERVEEGIAKAAEKDDPEKFAKRLEKLFVETKGGDLKHVRSLEILDRIHEKIPEGFKKELREIRGEFSERLKEDLEEFVKKHEKEAPRILKETLEELPGDKARRLVILEEIRERAEKRVSEALKDTEQILEKIFEEREELAEHASEAIARAKERLAKLEAELREFPDVPQSARRLAENAKSHLEEAIRAHEFKKHREAFGQARSAEVLARNALRFLEEKEEPEDEDLKEDMGELEERLNGWEKRIESLSEELRPKAKEALENARLHLRLARENLEKGALREAKKRYEEAKRFERMLERILRELFRFHDGVAPRAATEMLPPRGISCEEIKKRLAELEERLRAETVSEEDYKEKRGALRRDLATCKEMPSAFPETPARPAPKPLLPPPVSRCKEFEQQLIALKEFLGRGEISKEDFFRKTEILQKELSECIRGGAAPTPMPPESAKPGAGIICTQEYRPVCGIDGKTYSNSCMAKAAGVEGIQYEGECGKPKTEEAPAKQPAIAPPPPPSATDGTPQTTAGVSEPVWLKIEADDNGFYPQNFLTVPKGVKVHLAFVVRSEKVHYGGLDFRSSKFKTETVKPGGTTSVEFTADETLKITSYWPLTDTAKAALTIEVK